MKQSPCLDLYSGRRTTSHNFWVESDVSRLLYQCSVNKIHPLSCPALFGLDPSSVPVQCTSALSARSLLCPIYHWDANVEDLIRSLQWHDEDEAVSLGGW